MISCTEFIPLYSEFFKYLDKRGGHDAVVEYWNYISDNGIGDITNPNSLRSFVERDPDGAFFGAIKYWNHTLSEEACDVLKVIDVKNHRCYTHMRHCPSRGMLNELRHIEPYYDYCGHCNVLYSRVLENYGVEFKMDHSKIANAECTSCLYEKGDEPDESIKVIDGTKTVVDIKSEDNKYLHRDFHTLGDLALRYCGETFGDREVVAFLRDFAKNYFSPVIERARREGIAALAEWLEKIYEAEEASELIHTEINGNTLTVTVEKCPAVEYMRSLGQEPSKYYVEQTRTVYSTVAKESGFSFSLDYYRENGAARFSFSQK